MTAADSSQSLLGKKRSTLVLVLCIQVHWVRSRSLVLSLISKEVLFKIESYRLRHSTLPENIARQNLWDEYTSCYCKPMPILQLLFSGTAENRLGVRYTEIRTWGEQVTQWWLIRKDTCQAKHLLLLSVFFFCPPYSLSFFLFFFPWSHLTKQRQMGCGFKQQGSFRSMQKPVSYYWLKLFFFLLKEVHTLVAL